MFRKGDKVYVMPGYQEGVIEEVSTWQVVNGALSSDTPCYFVRVQEWDNDTNGGRRWVDEAHLSRSKSRESVV